MSTIKPDQIRFLKDYLIKLKANNNKNSQNTCLFLTNILNLLAPPTL